ncbi:Flp pilus assembly protein CpaB [Pararhizobium sp.]|uniref:Flp pilus assembly protein CpaB n=1 Tax=Pararhizobium sp. TaxID=1977563 RepID=UPI0027292BD0|nr:Flp pilus assembly protein CpaB [Pararhizobium sp.]MDO9417856.1 Flp pilus assembly protein CpaB [Pararhizobium sp.]
MKPARIIILTVAIVSAGLAGFLALQLTGNTVNVISAEPVIEREPSVSVLVAAENLPVGARLNAGAAHWLDWPKGAVSEGMITQDARPEALAELDGAVVRLPIFSGEPIRPEKIADSNSRIMSSLLPAGKMAVATEITVATGAGGFILPNDRVDIIMVRKGDGDAFMTEKVLSNIRVLAIDQQIQENEDGSKSAIGTTATLELTPEQAKVIVVVQQMAERISLALRSVADAHEPDTSVPDYLLSGGDGQPAVQVIKSGSIVKSENAVTSPHQQ